jgi:hypothetical protein
LQLAGKRGGGREFFSLHILDLPGVILLEGIRAFQIQFSVTCHEKDTETFLQGDCLKLNYS